MSKTQHYIPNENDIILIDLDPASGKEIGKLRPALVMTSKTLNEKTGTCFIIPISTSIRGGPLEVPVNNIERKSVACPNLGTTVDFKARHAKKITEAESGVLEETTLKLMAILPVTKAMAYAQSNSGN